MKRSEMIEKLAKLEHDQWMSWAASLMDSETLSQDRVNRWLPYMVDYDKLSEEVKAHDRVWAERVLKTLEEAGMSPPEIVVTNYSLHKRREYDYMGNVTKEYDVEGVPYKTSERLWEPEE